MTTRPRAATPPSRAGNRPAGGVKRVGAAPKLSVSLASGGVLLEWEKPPDPAGHRITGYRLYRSRSKGSRGSLLAGEATGLGASAKSFLDTSVPKGKTLTFYTLVCVEEEVAAPAAAAPATKTPAPAKPKTMVSGHRDRYSDYPYRMIQVPGLSASLVPGGVLLGWQGYSADDLAGHHLIGYRIYRSSHSGQWGSRIADENSGLGPDALSFTDTGVPGTFTEAYYTLVAVEPIDFGSRPYGEGGSVPYGV